MSTTIQHRRGTAAEWTAENPTLAEGEWGYETDTGFTKIGDGTTAYLSLPYVAGGESRFYGATQFPLDFNGSPDAVALSQQVPHRAMSDALLEAVAGTLDLPEGWASADVYLWTINHAGGGANNAVFQVYFRNFADLDVAPTATTSDDTGVVTVAISGTQYTVDRNSLGNVTLATTGRANVCIVYRRGSDGGDVFSGDLGFVGIELVRTT